MDVRVTTFPNHIEVSITIHRPGLEEMLVGELVVGCNPEYPPSFWPADFREAVYLANCTSDRSISLNTLYAERDQSLNSNNTISKVVHIILSALPYLVYGVSARWFVDSLIVHLGNTIDPSFANPEPLTIC